MLCVRARGSLELYSILVGTWMCPVPVVVRLVLVVLPRTLMRPRARRVHACYAHDCTARVFANPDTARTCSFTSPPPSLQVAVTIKYADNILRGFAQALALIIGALGSYMLFEFHLTLMFTLGCALVIGAGFLYGSSARSPQELCEALAGCPTHSDAAKDSGADKDALIHPAAAGGSDMEEEEAGLAHAPAAA